MNICSYLRGFYLIGRGLFLRKQDFSESRSVDYFRNLYAQNPDPWNFINNPYEHKKHQETLNVLENRRFKNAFEIGCSVGILTKQLAGFCDGLLAIDVAERALEQARAQCLAMNHVDFQLMQVPQSWPENQVFDLVVLSEILIYLVPQDIAALTSRVIESLAADGTVLLVNCTIAHNEPSGGDEAAEAFIRHASPNLNVIRHIRRQRYRIDLLHPGAQNLDRAKSATSQLGTLTSR